MKIGEYNCQESWLRQTGIQLKIKQTKKKEKEGKRRGGGGTPQRGRGRRRINKGKMKCAGLGEQKSSRWTYLEVHQEPGTPTTCLGICLCSLTLFSHWLWFRHPSVAYWDHRGHSSSCLLPTNAADFSNTLGRIPKDGSHWLGWGRMPIPAICTETKGGWVPQRKSEC